MKISGCGFKQKIIEYYYNELPAEEKIELEQHLKTCSACTEELRSLALVLERMQKVSRPGIPGSFYFSVKEKLAGSQNLAKKFFGVPLAAGLVLLVLLSFVSYNNNISLDKETEIDELYLLSGAFELDSKEINNFDLELLADDIFLEENLLSFGN